MSRNARIAAVIVLAAAVGGGYGLWYLFFREAGPPPVTVATNPPASASVAPGVTVGPARSGTTGATAGTLEGNWVVDPSIGSFSDFSGSFVGYRVQEQLAGVGANTAVGRTPDVIGSLTLTGTAITAVQIEANLTTLESDDDRRDGQLSRQGIQTSQFPTSTFTLTSPIQLGSLPAEGQAISATASGNLTLHGVTKPVQIPVQAKLSNGVVTVTGSIDILFADFGIERPSSFVVLSIDDHGIMEFQLQLRHS
jgi:polyisoprenoid-binding protein YceI